MLGKGGTIAARQSVTPDPTFFEVRSVDGQDVAFPFAGGKAHGCMQRILGRMRPAIHPDGALGVPGEMMDVDGDQLLGVVVVLVPHANTRETGGVIGRVNTALVFR